MKIGNVFVKFSFVTHVLFLMEKIVTVIHNNKILNIVKFNMSYNVLKDKGL